MEKPVIYVAGAVSKSPATSKIKFAATTKQLRALGYIVINPHELCEGIPVEEWQKCMRICLAKMVSDADLVVLLDDWQESKGATIEFNTATNIGIKTTTLNDFLRDYENFNRTAIL